MNGVRPGVQNPGAPISEDRRPHISGGVRRSGRRQGSNEVAFPIGSARVGQEVAHLSSCAEAGVLQS